MVNRAKEWTKTKGKISDPEDASYVYESDPDTEVSSDSASEVSVHTIGVRRGV